MTIGAATEAFMGELHNAIATRLKIHVDDLESDPRYVQMAIKFCSDNKITVVPSENNAAGRLSDALEKRKKRIFGDADNITDMSTEMAKRIANGE